VKSESEKITFQKRLSLCHCDSRFFSKHFIKLNINL
jgi:hypothetical protein